MIPTIQMEVIQSRKEKKKENNLQHLQLGWRPKNPEQKRDWFFCRENKGDVKTVWGLGGRVIKLSKCQSQQTVRVVTRMVHLY